MRITRVYTDQSLETGFEVELGEDAARHLISVLRLKTGEPVILFNGRGGEYRGVVARSERKRLLVTLQEFVDCERESPLAIHLGIGISRSEKMDLVIQKATELGVVSISPLFTDRIEVKLKGERAEKKLRHWRQVAISACEQCRRNRLPRIAEPQLLENWQRIIDADIKLVLHHRSRISLAELKCQTPSTAALLIGPEGGLAVEEIAGAEDRGFEPLALGPRVLRTETAPLAAISILQSLWGDMK